MAVTRRPMEPGETTFGGRGILIRFDPYAKPSGTASTKRNSSAPGSTEPSNSDDPMADAQSILHRELLEARKRGTGTPPGAIVVRGVHFYNTAGLTGSAETRSTLCNCGFAQLLGLGALFGRGYRPVRRALSFPRGTFFRRSSPIADPRSTG